MRRPPPHSLLVLLRATAQLQSTLSSPLVVVSNSSLSTVELRTLDDLWNLQGERECVVIIKRPLNTIILPARVQLVTQFYIAEEGGWYYDYRFVLIILIHPRLALLLLLFNGGGWLFEYQELYNLLAIIKAGALHVPRFNYTTTLLFIELPQLRRTRYTIGISAFLWVWYLFIIIYRSSIINQNRTNSSLLLSAFQTHPINHQRPTGDNERLF